MKELNMYINTSVGKFSLQCVQKSNTTKNAQNTTIIRPTFVSKYDHNTTKICTFFTKNTTHLQKYDQNTTRSFLTKFF